MEELLAKKYRAFGQHEHRRDLFPLAVGQVQKYLLQSYLNTIRHQVVVIFWSLYFHFMVFAFLL